MKRLAGLLVAVVAFASGRAAVAADAPTTAAAWPKGLPVYDHVVIVIEENKDVEQVLGKDADAPYIKGTLLARGANLTQMFGEEHNSQGNYYWLFSGGNQGVDTHDHTPPTDHTHGFPFKSNNLGHQLLSKKGLSFRCYSESLPQIGFQDDFSLSDDKPPKRLYARKHAPWVSFENVPSETHVPFEARKGVKESFPTDPARFKDLPTVSFVVPNLRNDMHDDDVEHGPVRAGDDWLGRFMGKYVDWATDNNSLFILTFDENDKPPGSHFFGLTDPFVDPKKDDAHSECNQIVTLLVGARVKHGDFPEGKGVTHVNILRTLEAMYGLERSGKQQANAAKGGIGEDPITDVFKVAK